MENGFCRNMCQQGWEKDLHLSFTLIIWFLKVYFLFASFISEPKFNLIFLPLPPPSSSFHIFHSVSGCTIGYKQEVRLCEGSTLLNPLECNQMTEKKIGHKWSVKWNKQCSVHSAERVQRGRCFSLWAPVKVRLGWVVVGCLGCKASSAGLTVQTKPVGRAGCTLNLTAQTCAEWGTRPKPAFLY